jgi:hypothetical protein
MRELMNDAEIDRLRKAICRSFNSSPHKKKKVLAGVARDAHGGGESGAMQGTDTVEGIITAHASYVTGM